MTSLYLRATPPQRLILRIIEGAVKNAHDAHQLKFDPRFARSIAKRAAGTLTAQWPDVLAARSLSPSESDPGRNPQVAMVKPVTACMAGRRSSQWFMASRRGASEVRRRSPLRQLWQQLASQCWHAKNAGQLERLETLRDVLRLVHIMEQEIR